jgi:hypothetical protein
MTPREVNRGYYRIDPCESPTFSKRLFMFLIYKIKWTNQNKNDLKWPLNGKTKQVCIEKENMKGLFLLIGLFVVGSAVLPMELGSLCGLDGPEITTVIPCLDRSPVLGCPKDYKQQIFGNKTIYTCAQANATNTGGHGPLGKLCGVSADAPNSILSSVVLVTLWVILKLVGYKLWPIQTQREYQSNLISFNFTQDVLPAISKCSSSTCFKTSHGHVLG